MADDEVEFRAVVTFEKGATSPTGDLVRGWASVAIDANGETVVDDQDDRVTVANLQKVAHHFIANSRVAKVSHNGKPIGEVVGSVIVDDAFAKAMGMTSPKRGWWVDFAVHDEATQKAAARGDFKGFSLGGRGRRIQKQVS